MDLVQDSIDCVLRVGPLSDSNLIARSIGELPLVNLASPSYLAAHGTPQMPEELANGHLAVNYASPSSGRVEDWEWRNETRVLHSLALPARVSVNSAEGYIACRLAGLGRIKIPAYDVRAHLLAGDLIEVMPDHRADAMKMTLLYPHREHLPRRVQVFADWLEELLRREVMG